MGTIHCPCPDLSLSSVQGHYSLANALELSGNPHTLSGGNTVDTYLGKGLTHTFQATA